MATDRPTLSVALRARRAVLGPVAITVILLAPRVRAQPFGPTGPEFRVNTYTTGYQVAPAIDADSSGAFLVVWSGPGQGEDGSGIFGRRFTSLASPLGGEFRINTTTMSEQVNPRVAGRDSGRFSVVWSGPSLAGEALGQRFTSVAAPDGGEFRVNALPTTYFVYPSTAGDAFGNFVVAWDQRDESFTSIHAQRFTADGSRAGAEFRVNAVLVPDYARPAVASAPTAGFVIVWHSYPPLVFVRDEGGRSPLGGAIPEIDVRGRRFDATGTALGPEFRVNTSTTNQVVDLTVAMEASGGFVVVWTRLGDAAPMDVYAQRFDAGGAPVAGNFRMNSITTGTQRFPAAAFDSLGNVLVVWDSDASGDRDVRGQFFRPSGAPLGGEFRVNTFTPGSQLSAAVAEAAPGRFVVVWTGPGDTSAYSIQAQRFCSVLAGDANGDGAITVADVLYLINRLFAGGSPPLGGSDVNGDHVLDVSDILYLINHLFAGGPAPACTSLT